MRQTIKQRGRHLGVAKDTGPFGEGQIGRDHHARPLIELREQVEEQSATGWTEWQIAQFIENHQIDVHQTVGQPTGLAGRFLLLQCIDEIDGRVETHPLVVLGNTGNAERSGQMRLAGTGPADEHDVLRCLGEGAFRQLHPGQF